MHKTLKYLKSSTAYLLKAQLINRRNENFIANKFYYRRGGDCIYTMNLEKMLKEKGHDAISMED